MMDRLSANTSELPLLELFTNLQEAGLPLGIDDYHLLLKALQGGFGTKDKTSLKKLCETLWIKSTEGQSILNYYFELILAEEEYFTFQSQLNTSHLQTTSSRLVQDGKNNKYTQTIWSEFEPVAQGQHQSISTEKSSKYYSKKEDWMNLAKLSEILASLWQRASMVNSATQQEVKQELRLLTSGSVLALGFLFTLLQFTDVHLQIPNPINTKSITSIADDKPDSTEENRPQPGLLSSDNQPTLSPEVESDNLIQIRSAARFIYIWASIFFGTSFVIGGVIFAWPTGSEELSSPEQGGKPSHFGTASSIEQPRWDIMVDSENHQNTSNEREQKSSYFSQDEFFTPEYSYLKTQSYLKSSELLAIHSMQANIERSNLHIFSCDSYLPLTNRQMKQTWRYFRLNKRDGLPKIIDISATVREVSRKGIFLKPAMIPQATNQIELCVLIDREGSMVPFHSLSQQLVQTAIGADRLSSSDIYFFHNYPKSVVYKDLYRTQAEKILTVIARFYRHRTAIMIVSDGGAARGGFHSGRLRRTEYFLDTLRSSARAIVWLNPMPRERWLGTTAEAISSKVNMFEMSREGMKEAIKNLKTSCQY